MDAPAKGSLWIRTRCVDLGVKEHVVTSIRNGLVYVRPTWETPIPCRAVGYEPESFWAQFSPAVHDDTWTVRTPSGEERYCGPSEMEARRVFHTRKSLERVMLYCGSALWMTGFSPAIKTPEHQRARGMYS